MSKLNDYFEQAVKLLPQGLIWTAEKTGRLGAVLMTMAGRLADCHSRADNLINEAIPQTAQELLPEWEAFAGLPDECTVGEALTLSERQDAVVEKLTAKGNLSVARFYELARKLGYDIEIVEFIPFTCGRSVCGGPHVLGNLLARFYWKVIIYGDRLHWFRCGRSTTGERLGWLTPARDLECFLNRRRPAHTIIIYDYKEMP